MSRRDVWIHRHLRRLRLGQFLQRAGEWLAGFLLVFGMSVLLVKRLIPAGWPHVLWLAAAAIPVTALAWRLSRRGAFTRDESVALLDRALNAGGLLMTLSEAPDEEWSRRLPNHEGDWREALPRVRPRRLASYLTLPLLFAVGVCFVPLRQIDSRDLPPPVTAGQQAAQRLEQLLAALEKAEILAEQDRESLTEEVRKLVEETRQAPLTHEKWETIDALEHKLRTELTRAQLQMDKLLSAANTLLQASGLGELELTDEQRERLEEELLETLMKMEQQQSSSSAATAGSRQLQELLQRLSKAGAQTARLPTDPQERQQLLDELRQVLEQEQQRLAELRKECPGGQCPGGQCQQCGGQCEHGQAVCGQCQGQADGRPGQGGVSRGPGAADLTWGNESDEHGIRFKQTVLPPGFLEDPKDEVIGVRLTAPKVEPAGSAERAAARDVDPTTGRETWDRRLRPRHQQAVKQFFQSTP